MTSYDLEYFSNYFAPSELQKKSYQIVLKCSGLVVGEASINPFHDRDVKHVSNLQKSDLEFREIKCMSSQEIKNVNQDLALSDMKSKDREENFDEDPFKIDAKIIPGNKDGVSEIIDFSNSRSNCDGDANKNINVVNGEDRAKTAKVTFKEIVNVQDLMIFNPDNRGSVKCKLCYQNGVGRNIKRGSLWRHIKYCHINTAPVLCRHCNQGQSALNLKRHEKACKLKVMNNNGDSYMNSNMVKKYPKLSMKHIVRVKKLNPKFFKSLN